MPPALSPDLALDYVRELSADVRAGIVLDGAGEALAGPAALAQPARELLAAGGDAAELQVASVDGVVCAVRTPAHAAVAVCGRFAIAGVVLQDLRAALAGLEGRPPTPGPEGTADVGDAALTSAAERLISALQSGSGA